MSSQTRDLSATEPCHHAGLVCLRIWLTFLVLPEVAPELPTFSSNSRREFKNQSLRPLDTPQSCLTSSREAGPQRVPPRWTAQAVQFFASSLGLLSRPHKPIPEIETALVSRQKAPASSGSPGLQQDPALAPAPTMPPPEDPSEDHEHNQSPAEVLLG